MLKKANDSLAQGAEVHGPSLDKINERLVRSFSEPRFTLAKTRAYPIQGGRERWMHEVQEQLALLGPSADPRRIAA